MKVLKIIMALWVCVTFTLANSLTQKELYDQNFSINKGAFKIVEFEKMIRNIKVSSEEFIEVDFLETNANPLKGIKIFAKAIGNGNILITFDDATSMHININIVENLTTTINVAKQISPNLDITQSNGKIILKGTIQEQKTKDKILDLFSKSGIDLKTDLVDLTTLENPDKMIKVKLYAVEINNNKGLDLKNNWFVSSKNYMEVKDPGGLYYNKPLNSFGADYQVDSYKEVTDTNGDTSVVPNSWNTVTNAKTSQANNQRNTLVNGAIDQIMANSVSLTGGLTGAANYLGKHFNAGLTLNYLSSKGVANILDETTLVTLENKKAEFHAGGTIYLKVQTTTDQGVPSTQIQNINYGLQLDIQAENIVNEQFINLNIITKSTQIDWANQVDGIPNFTEKSIKTNVVAANNSTIILGGLINTQNSKDIDKIPLLGDIPILGFLFTSQAFREGKSELVFFITPEIVDPKSNNEKAFLNQKTQFLNDLDVNSEEKVKEKKEDSIDSKEENIPSIQKNNISSEEKLNSLLNYN
jgi:pilus assembly protein CpaC